MYYKFIKQLQILDKTFRLINFSFLPSPFSLQRGYTFIELLVVFSIMGVIGMFGMASFVGFNNNQIVEEAASDVTSALTLARGRALSQIKPSTCTAVQVLTGYRVAINIAARTYRVEALCGSQVVPITTKSLPSQIGFDPSSPSSVVFSVPGGIVSSPSVVMINGFGKTKQIIIDSAGTISRR